MILDLFYKGEAALRAQHAAAEADKIQTLRGGSAGCLLEDNTTIGCPHEALARYMGYSLNSVLSQGYFDGGIGNECIWELNIEASGTPFKCEEDIPVRYMLDGKYLITGRPDMVIGFWDDPKNHVFVEEGGKSTIVLPLSNFIPTRGIELKGAFAIDSAADRLFGVKPDAKHLCQAGLYMLAMELPWSLVYTCNITGELGFFRKKEYNEARLPLGKVEFLLEYQGDTLYYEDPLTGDMIKTIITKKGILDYYRLIVDMYETRQVGLTKLAGKTATGEDYQWDPNVYSDFLAMVPVDQGWDAFQTYCQKASRSSKLIRYSKGKYLVYQVPEPKGPLYKATMDVIGKYNTIREARRAVYDIT